LTDLLVRTRFIQLVKDGKQAPAQRDAEVAKGKELLERDRDIRERMGALELYMADVRDVSRAGTNNRTAVSSTPKESLLYSMPLIWMHNRVFKKREFVPSRSAERTGQAACSRSRNLLRRQRQQQALGLRSRRSQNTARRGCRSCDGGIQRRKPAPKRQAIAAYLRVNSNHP
jgi:hypothetical protein